MPKLWVPMDAIEFAELFGPRLATFLIRERRTARTTEFARMLTDGKNHAWVFGDPMASLSASAKRDASRP